MVKKVVVVVILNEMVEGIASQLIFKVFVGSSKLLSYKLQKRLSRLIHLKDITSPMLFFRHISYLTRDYFVICATLTVSISQCF